MASCCAIDSHLAWSGCCIWYPSGIGHPFGTGTTIKLIAERGGISEGVIYRHFAHAPAPARDNDRALPAAHLDAGTHTPAARPGALRDPQVARRFSRENFAVAMDRLAEAWREVEDRYGFPFESPDISARTVMGMALILALESHHTRKFDRDRAVALISEAPSRASSRPSTRPAAGDKRTGRLSEPGCGRRRRVGAAVQAGDAAGGVRSVPSRHPLSDRRRRRVVSFRDGLVTEIGVFQQDTHLLLKTLDPA